MDNGDYHDLQSIEPALKQVQGELVLVVDYVPYVLISVHLPRKSKNTENLEAIRLEIDPLDKAYAPSGRFSPSR